MNKEDRKKDLTKYLEVGFIEPRDGEWDCGFCKPPYHNMVVVPTCGSCILPRILHVLAESQHPLIGHLELSPTQRYQRNTAGPYYFGAEALAKADARKKEESK